MKTELAILTIGTLLLMPLALLEPSTSVYRVRFLGLALLSAVLSQFALDGALSSFELNRRTDFLHVMHGLKPIDRDRPILLLLGSSYTARDVDGEYLEKKFKEHGLGYQVRQLSYPGINAYEQDYYLDLYLSEYPPPNLVLIELGTEQSLAVKAENSLKHSTIEFHDFERAVTLLSGLAISGQENIFHEARSVIIHGLAREFHLGILHALEPHKTGGVKPGFLPEESGADAPTIEIVKQGLYQTVSAQAVYDYRAKFRRIQEKRLLQAGIQKVVYWQPPSVSPEQRLRTGSLCESLQPRCVAFDAPALLAGAFWTDKGHLNTRGARLLTGWLATRLSEREEFAHVFR